MLSLIVLVTCGAVLLSLPISSNTGQSTSWVDAWFTSASALSVTGLAVVDTKTHWSLFGQSVILALIQIGGLGFMVGASLLLAMFRRGESLRDQLLLHDGSPTLDVGSSRAIAYRTMKFTLLAEAIGASILTLRFSRVEPWPSALWDGIFHAISAFCNAGFDRMGGGQSLAGYADSRVVNITIMLLIQAGSLSLLVLSEAWHARSWRQLSLEAKLVLSLNALLVAIGTGSFLLLEWNASLSSLHPADRPMAAVFQSIAARTAGFATVDFSQVTSLTTALWIPIMMIGGASGSAAGGVKLATFAVLVLAVTATLRGATHTQIAGRRITSTQVMQALAVTMIYVAAQAVLTFALGVAEIRAGHVDVPILSLLFESMSALATVGLSVGITAELSTVSKLILGVAMLFGRVGPLVLAYSLRTNRPPARFTYPEETLRLG